MSRPPLTNCPTKVKARVASIIKPWHLDAIPSSQAYVTLCGPMTTKNSTTLLPNSELKHLVRERFIEPRQFHGVEYKEDVSRRNAEAVDSEGYPASNRPTLYHGDLLVVLSELLRKKVKIAVLNIDLQVGPKEGTYPLTRALSMMNTMPKHPALVVWNVMLKTRYRKQDMTPDLEAVLLKDSRFRRARARGHWESPRQVRYWRSNITMHSIILTRPGKPS